MKKSNSKKLLQLKKAKIAKLDNILMNGIYSGASFTSTIPCVLVEGIISSVRCIEAATSSFQCYVALGLELPKETGREVTIV